VTLERELVKKDQNSVTSFMDDPYILLNFFHLFYNSLGLELKCLKLMKHLLSTWNGHVRLDHRRFSNIFGTSFQSVCDHYAKKASEREKYVFLLLKLDYKFKGQLLVVTSHANSESNKNNDERKLFVFDAHFMDPNCYIHTGGPRYMQRIGTPKIGLHITN